MLKLRLLIKNLLSYLSTPLPVGLAEFNKWSDDIIDLSGDFADRESMKYAIASNLIHLPHTVSSKPKQYFIRTMRKAAANQVASQVFQDIKFKQQQAVEAAQTAAAILEATATGVAENVEKNKIN